MALNGLAKRSSAPPAAAIWPRKPSPPLRAASIDLATSPVASARMAIWPAIKLLTPASPTFCLSCNQALSSRLTLAASRVVASSRLPASSPLRVAANCARRSGPTCPISSSLDSSPVVTPMLSAKIWNARGRRSPSWPRSSSAWIWPLLTICTRARMAPSVSSTPRPMTTDACAMLSKISRVARPSRLVPLVAAASRPYMGATAAKLTPSLSVTWRR